MKFSVIISCHPDVVTNSQDPTRLKGSFDVVQVLECRGFPVFVIDVVHVRAPESQIDGTSNLTTILEPGSN